MLSRKPTLLTTQLKRLRELQFCLRSINDIDTKAALEIADQQLVIGKSLLTIEKILKKYHPECLEASAYKKAAEMSDNGRLSLCQKQNQPKKQRLF